MNPRIKEIIIIFLISFIFAAGYNTFSSSGLPYIYQQISVEFNAGQIVNLEQAQQMHSDTTIIFLDSRPVRYFKKEHIPGAVNIPYSSKELEKLTKPFKKSQKFVVYCYSKTCNMARILSDLLAQNDFENIALFEDGISVWKEAGLATEKENK